MKSVTKLVCALGIIGVTQSSFAAIGDNASATFQWVGTVAPTDTSNGLTIVAAVGSEKLTDGSVLFDVDDSGSDPIVTIRSASELSFDVKEGDETGPSLAVYDYTLASFKKQAGGSHMERIDPAADGLNITSNGTVLVENVTVANYDNSTSQNILTLENEGAAGISGLAPGESLIVQAAILVEQTQ